MTEHQYLQAQEDATRKALRLLKIAETTCDLDEKFGCLKRYRNICEGARRLRIAYNKRIQNQKESSHA